MADRFDDTETEKPLDPAVVRVQQRLQRMMLWSRGIMLVGFVALFCVIFYKFYWSRPTASEALTVSPVGPSLASLPMPEGGRLLDARVEGNRLVVTIDAPKAASVLVIDMETMQTLRRLELTKTP